MNRKAHVAYNFNCLFENEGLLKVRASHIHCMCGNISEILSDRVVVTTDTNRICYMANPIEAVPVTLSDLQGHSLL